MSGLRSRVRRLEPHMDLTRITHWLDLPRRGPHPIPPASSVAVGPKPSLGCTWYLRDGRVSHVPPYCPKGSAQALPALWDAFLSCCCCCCILSGVPWPCSGGARGVLGGPLDLVATPPEGAREGVCGAGGDRQAPAGSALGRGKGSQRGWVACLRDAG